MVLTVLTPRFPLSMFTIASMKAGRCGYHAGSDIPGILRSPGSLLLPEQGRAACLCSRQAVLEFLVPFSHAFDFRLGTTNLDAGIARLSQCHQRMDASCLTIVFQKKSNFHTSRPPRPDPRGKPPASLTMTFSSCRWYELSAHHLEAKMTSI